jgi:transcriptional regulator with PAS, ATPase and Fis domain
VRAKTVDVRVIAATNQDLSQMVKGGAFREDLYWRLNVVTVKLPALRKRREDIGLLVDHLLDRFNRELGVAVKGVSPAARRLLVAHDWPGNVPRLENTICRAMISAKATH